MNKLITFFFTLLVLSGFSQQGPPAIGVVKGKVVSETGNEPIEYATVVLKSLRDSSIAGGGVTDEKGNFEVTEIKLGRYVLIVSFIGFTPYESAPFGLGRDGVSKEFGEIKLTASMELEEVEVQVDRPLITTSIDKKVFNAEQAITAAGGTALDVLKNVPSVQVDQDGNVSLRGNQNVTVLIDGKPSGLTGGSRQALLEQIPASSIENIEVITNPSAKYDPDGMSGIINIILKKNKMKGFNGLISIQAGNGRIDSTSAKFSTINKYNVNGSVAYKNQKFNVYGNYTLNLRNRFSEGLADQQSGTTGEMYGLDQTSYEDGSRNSNMLKAGFDYYLNKKNTINTSITWNTRGRNEIERIHYIDLFNDDISAIRIRDNREDNGGTSLDFNVGYTKEFEKKGQNLVIQYTQSTGSGTEEGFFLEDYYDTGGLLFDNYIDQYNDQNNKNSLNTIQLDYVHPVNDKFKFETGYKSIFRSIDNDFYSETNNIVDTALNNHFLYNEQIHAVYGIGAYKINDTWSTQLGLRQEFTQYESQLVDSDTTFPNSYTPLFPSAYVNYAFDQYSSLNVSYSRRINRPSIRSLNPFTDYSNPLSLRSGNPFLMPEYIDSYELAYAKYTEKGLSINPSLYYKHTTDVITRVVRTDPEVVNRRIVRQENIGITDTYGAEMVFSGKIKSYWRMTVSGNVYWNKTTSNLTDINLNNDALGGNGNLINNFTVKKNTDIQIMSWYNAPRVFALGRIKQMGSVDFAVKHTIWGGKADISFRLSDVFDTQRFAIILDYEDQATNTTISDYKIYDWESRNVFVGFSYRFGKMDMGGGRGRGKGGRGGDKGEGGFDAGEEGGGL